MCDSRRPSEGADSANRTLDELLGGEDGVSPIRFGHPAFCDEGPGDRLCDYCGATIYVGLLHRVQMGSISWICEACYQRGQERYEQMVGQPGMEALG